MQNIDPHKTTITKEEIAVRNTMIALLLFGCAGAVQAAELKIAVINPLGAISGTEQYKKAVAQLEKDTADQKAKLMMLQTDLNVCKQRLSTDGATMSATEQAKLKTDCEAKYRDFQGLGQNYNKIASDREQAILKDIGPKFQKAVDALAKEGGYDLIVQKDALLFAKPAFDVSEQVTTRINAIK